MRRPQKEFFQVIDAFGTAISRALSIKAAATLVKSETEETGYRHFIRDVRK